DDEERRLAAREEAVDHRRGDVRLAAAARPGEHEPAIGPLGERARVGDAATVLLLVARRGAAPALDERREGMARERADVRVAQQPFATRRAAGRDGAAARDRLSEVRVLRPDR